MSNARIVLDTNIVSYLMKGAPQAEAYNPHVQGRLLAITFITVGELYFGAEKRNWGEKKRSELETALRNFVVIPYDHEIARCYGRLVAESGSEAESRLHPTMLGLPPAPYDLDWPAPRHGAPLVTHNAKDFEGITALQVISEAGSGGGIES